MLALGVTAIFQFVDCVTERSWLGIDEAGICNNGPEETWVKIPEPATNATDNHLILGLFVDLTQSSRTPTEARIGMIASSMEPFVSNATIFLKSSLPG